MPNPNYIKGRKKEYKICKELKEQGYTIVQRTAGSHSPIDVIAIHKDLRIIKLVQAKPDSYSAHRINKLKEELHWLRDEFRVVFEVL